MKELPQISEAEWEIMNLLWDESPQSAQAIIDSLKAKQTWKPKTVKSLISRLVKKNAISFDIGDDRSYYYYPLYAKENFVKKEKHNFIEKVFGGELNVMFAAFINDSNISEEQLVECKDLLDKAIKQKRKEKNK